MIKLVNTFYRSCICLWTIFSCGTWFLINNHLNSYSFINVLAHNTHSCVSSWWEIGLGFDTEILEVFNFDSSGVWLITVVVHHDTAGNWALDRILVDEEIFSSKV